VCGYDDSPISRQVFPTLTTVHQPTREMGSEATRQLIHAIQNPSDGTMVKLSYALKLRHSTGPAIRT
jgi:LacI family transcriptional regulator